GKTAGGLKQAPRTDRFRIFRVKLNAGPWLDGHADHRSPTVVLFLVVQAETGICLVVVGMGPCVAKRAVDLQPIGWLPFPGDEGARLPAPAIPRSEEIVGIDIGVARRRLYRPVYIRAPDREPDIAPIGAEFG